MAREASSGGDREFHFTDADFRKIRQMIYDHAGISLTDHKKDMVYSRVTRRLRATRCETFQAYLDLLERDDGSEWEAFVNSLTTNLTAFFRESHHFPILAKHIVDLKKRPIRLWCSASSTGEEPYSMAISAIDAFGTFSPPIEIVASDIDTNVLAKAEAGIYSMDRVEKLPPDILRRFFLRGTGQWEGHAKVRSEVRKLISFRRVNLLDNQWPLSGRFDAIFCRNVMIYFDKETQYKILKKFTPLLEPHGLLFAGHSESLHHAADLFRLRGQTVYELTGAARSKPK